jgi:predicted transcriptional regulator
LSGWASSRRAAEHGPAFSAVEVDEHGNIVAKVLACAGLPRSARRSPDGRLCPRWGAFAEGLRPAQWSVITHAIKGVIDGCGYDRIDMIVSPWFDAGRRYALALGFTLDNLVFARRASGEGSA